MSIPNRLLCIAALTQSIYAIDGAVHRLKGFE